MNTASLLIDVGIILLLLVGIQRFRSPRGALVGNGIAAVALTLAVLTVGLRHEILSPALVLGMLAVGALIGWLVAVRVSMIQTPAMVASQNGAGALAAFLVCLIELVRQGGGVGGVEAVTGITGLALGAATFAGSVIAAGKLAGWLPQPPRSLRAHDVWLIATVIGIAVLGVLPFGMTGPAAAPLFLGILALASATGLLLAMRIGGADMPVLISFLNAASGMAAAFAGVAIGNYLLIAAGATVGASGTVLTLAMCRAMNRSLANVLIGSIKAGRKAGGSSAEVVGWPAPGTPESGASSDALAGDALAGDGAAADQGDEAAAPVSAPAPADPFERALEAFRTASSVVFIPGYGMAMAQAQFEAVELGRRFEADGKTVLYAVHPVAGRMPGHMHVLLSEAEAPWDQLRELEVNDTFDSTDLAIVIGASDVVNPAASELEGTPISGMPILEAHRAGTVVVINLDERPGYSGVPNQLYDRPNAVLLWGDAKDTLKRLLGALAQEPEPAST